MAGNSAEEALDVFLARIRDALDFIAAVTVIGTGVAEDAEHGVFLFVPGQSAPNALRLRTHGGVGELEFFATSLYRIAQTPDPRGRNRFRVDATLYQYKVLDAEGNEIVVYDWAPFGRSSVRSPHLHVPAAGSIVLKQRAGSPLEHQKTFLGSLHLPTGAIEIEDIVGISSASSRS